MDQQESNSKLSSAPELSEQHEKSCHRTVKEIYNDAVTQNLILLVIISHFVVNMIETQLDNEQIDDISEYILKPFYAIELAANMYANRGKFWKNGWNIGEFLIVTVSTLTYIGGLVLADRQIGKSLNKSSRVLQDARILIAVGRLKPYRLIVKAIWRCIVSSGAGWAGLLFVVMFFLYANIGCIIKASSHPARFGNLQLALTTLSQLFFEGFANINDAMGGYYVIIFCWVVGVFWFSILSTILIDTFIRDHTALEKKYKNELAEKIFHRYYCKEKHEYGEDDIGRNNSIMLPSCRDALKEFDKHLKQSEIDQMLKGVAQAAETENVEIDELDFKMLIHLHEGNSYNRKLLAKIAHHNNEVHNRLGRIEDLLENLVGNRSDMIPQASELNCNDRDSILNDEAQPDFEPSK